MEPAEELNYRRMRQNLVAFKKSEKQSRKQTRAAAKIKRGLKKHEQMKQFYMDHFTAPQLEMRLAALEAKQDTFKSSMIFFLGLFFGLIFSFFGEQIKVLIESKDLLQIKEPLLIAVGVFLIVVLPYIYIYSDTSYKKEIIKLAIKDKSLESI